ncbi:MAG TPA: DMT family transporter [Stellaceae bacterium]|nr:DMT family transporter [Stellaceae bacterium]
MPRLTPPREADKLAPRFREIPIPAKPADRFEALYPYLLLTLCMVIWSGNWVLGRAVRDDVPPVALTFARWAISALCLAPLAIPRLKGKGAILKRHAGLIAALGFLGVGFFQVAVYTGLRFTGAINAVLMNSVAPMFIIAIAWLIDGDRVTPRQFLGMLISFAGIVVIVTRGEFEQLLHLHFNIGDLIIFFAMPAWGFYCVLLRRVPKSLDTLGLLFAVNIAGLAMIAPAAAVEVLFFQAPRWTLFNLGTVLYIGVFASFLAYICWNRGVELVGANRAGFTTHLLPAFTTLLAVIFLGEELHPYHIVGIAVVLFGVYLATSARRKAVAIAVD